MRTGPTALLVVVSLLSGAACARAGELTVGTVIGHPGGEVTVPIMYRQGRGPAAAAVATDIHLSTRLTQRGCAPVAALSSSQKTVKCAEPRRGLVRVAIYGLNLDPVPDGEVARLTLHVSPQARAGAYRIRHRPSAADATGNDFRLRRVDGLIRVGQP